MVRNFLFVWKTFSPSLSDNFTGYIFLVVGFFCLFFWFCLVFLLALCVYYAISCWPAKFLLTSQWLVLCNFPYMWLVVFLLLLRFFNFCRFNYVFWWGALWVYLVWDSLWVLDFNVCFLPQIREALGCYSSNKFPFSFSCLPGIPIIRMLVYVMVSQSSLKLSQYFKILLAIKHGYFPLHCFQITNPFCISNLLIPTSVIFLSFF